MKLRENIALKILLLLWAGLLCLSGYLKAGQLKPKSSNYGIAKSVSAFSPVEQTVPIAWTEPTMQHRIFYTSDVLRPVLISSYEIILRRTNPHIHRPFKTPLVTLVPILGILICGYMMVNLGFDTWMRLIVWMAIGVLVYFLYGRKHSKLRNTPPINADEKILVSK